MSSLEYIYFVLNIRKEEMKQNMKYYWSLSEEMTTFYTELMSCLACELDLENFWRRQILDLFYGTWSWMKATGDIREGFKQISKTLDIVQTEGEGS